MIHNTSLLTRSGFNLDVSVFLAEVADMAYKPSFAIKAWALTNGFGLQCTVFDHDNIQGFWCATGDVAIFCFRGTSNPGQWIRDLRFLPVDHPWGAIHAGFRGGVENAEPDVQAFMSFASKANHVWITGHSLGGALAVIAAARLKQYGITSSIYTYGQPRVSLNGFGERFEIELPGKLFRFINGNDIVPRIPPGLIYQHFGTVKHIVQCGFEATGNELVDKEPPPLTKQEFDTLQASIQETNGESFEGSLPWISDHSISEYIRLLREIRG